MADFLLRLTQRTLGLTSTLQPLLGSMYEPGLAMESDYTVDWQPEPESSEFTTSQVPQSQLANAPLASNSEVAIALPAPSISLVSPDTPETAIATSTPSVVSPEAPIQRKLAHENSFPIQDQPFLGIAPSETAPSEIVQSTSLQPEIPQFRNQRSEITQSQNSSQQLSSSVEALKPDSSEIAQSQNPQQQFYSVEASKLDTSARETTAPTVSTTAPYSPQESPQVTFLPPIEPTRTVDAALFPLGDVDERPEQRSQPRQSPPSNPTASPEASISASSEPSFLSEISFPSVSLPKTSEVRTDALEMAMPAVPRSQPSELPLVYPSQSPEQSQQPVNRAQAHSQSLEIPQQSQQLGEPRSRQSEIPDSSNRPPQVSQSVESSEGSSISSGAPSGMPLVQLSIASETVAPIQRFVESTAGQMTPAIAESPIPIVEHQQARSEAIAEVTEVPSVNVPSVQPANRLPLELPESEVALRRDASTPERSGGERQRLAFPLVPLEKGESVVGRFSPAPYQQVPPGNRELLSRSGPDNLTISPSLPAGLPEHVQPLLQAMPETVNRSETVQPVSKQSDFDRLSPSPIAGTQNQERANQVEYDRALTPVISTQGQPQLNPTVRDQLSTPFGSETQIRSLFHQAASPDSPLVTTEASRQTDNQPSLTPLTSGIPANPTAEDLSSRMPPLENERRRSPDQESKSHHSGLQVPLSTDVSLVIPDDTNHKTDVSRDAVNSERSRSDRSSPSIIAHTEATNQSSQSVSSQPATPAVLETKDHLFNHASSRDRSLSPAVTPDVRNSSRLETGQPDSNQSGRDRTPLSSASSATQIIPPSQPQGNQLSRDRTPLSSASSATQITTVSQPQTQPLHKSSLGLPITSEFAGAAQASTQPAIQTISALVPSDTPEQQNSPMDNASLDTLTRPASRQNSFRPAVTISGPVLPPRQNSPILNRPAPEALSSPPPPREQPAPLPPPAPMPPPPLQPHRVARRRPTLSLTDYLQRRNGGGR